MIQTMHKAAVSSFNWVYILLIGWVLMAGGALTPTWVWFDVKDIHVYDSHVGQTPKMDVEREIRYSFSARWTATVMRKDQYGRFSTYCASTGENDYRPENSIPIPVTLDWWTWPIKCELPAGDYRLNTLWTLDIPFFPKKTLRVVSNEFNVREP